MIINKENYKIILWGHKNHHNTFYFIHNAYNKAFKHLGFNTFWFDDQDNVNNFDFSNSIFFTEGQVDKNIPLRDDCFYILHNCGEKYKILHENNRCIVMQIYTDDILKNNYTKLEECIYADYDGKCIYFPWATDLLPFEIEKNKPNKPFNNNSTTISWVGTIGDGIFGNIEQISPFKKACAENNINFTHSSLISIEDSISLIKNSYIAPTIVGKWQQMVGCIPCRIFKNISYGQMAITNSPRIYELFQHKIIYNQDSYQLFYDAKKYLENMPLIELHNLMNLIRDKHTYINRINTIFDFIIKALKLS